MTEYAEASPEARVLRNALPGLAAWFSAEDIEAAAAAVATVVRANYPRVEIDAALGEPTTCRVWIGGHLAFSGMDLGSVIERTKP